MNYIIENRLSSNLDLMNVRLKETLLLGVEEQIIRRPKSQSELRTDLRGSFQVVAEAQEPNNNYDDTAEENDVFDDDNKQEANAEEEEIAESEDEQPEEPDIVESDEEVDNQVGVEEEEAIVENDEAVSGDEDAAADDEEAVAEDEEDVAVEDEGEEEEMVEEEEEETGIEEEEEEEEVGKNGNTDNILMPGDGERAETGADVRFLGDIDQRIRLEEFVADALVKFRAFTLARLQIIKNSRLDHGI